MDNDKQQRAQVPVQKEQNSDYSQMLKVNNECGFSKVEQDSILRLFKKYDIQKYGYIPFHDLLDLLHDYGFCVDQGCKEKIFKDLEDRNTHKLDFQTVLFVVRVSSEHERFRKKQEEENMSSEYIDAFVALGGNPDMTGHVKKDTILEIMSNEFELVFDMDDLLERIEVSSDELDFDNFKRLFKVSDDPRSLSKASSVLSLLSQRSRRSNKTNSSVQTVKVRVRDFEKYMQKLEQEEKEKDDTHSQSYTLSPVKR